MNTNVETCDVPMVSEDYLDAAPSGAALLKIPGFTISSWGAPRHSVPLDSETFCPPWIARHSVPLDNTSDVKAEKRRASSLLVSRVINIVISNKQRMGINCQ